MGPPLRLAPPYEGVTSAPRTVRAFRARTATRPVTRSGDGGRHGRLAQRRVRAAIMNAAVVSRVFPPQMRACKESR